MDTLKTNPRYAFSRNFAGSILPCPYANRKPPPRRDPTRLSDGALLAQPEKSAVNAPQSASKAAA